MGRSISRREVLRNLLSATAAGVIGSRRATAKNQSVFVGGRPVEIRITLVTPQTVRFSFIPLEGGQYTREMVDGPLSLQIFPGSDARFMLYEDDGSTFNYRKGERLGLIMEWNDKARRLTLQLAERSRPAFVDAGSNAGTSWL